MAETGFDRLLVCKTHGVMWKMRPYDGPPEYDQELRELCDRHNAQVPDPDNCRALIYRTDPETASKLDVETALKKELAEQDVFIRDFRDELKVDALKCYNKHNRPTGGCIDWCADDKTIGRKTGVPKEHRQYLCMYCPVGSYVAHEERKALGLYGK
jgi:hypothetical protein